MAVDAFETNYMQQEPLHKICTVLINTVTALRRIMLEFLKAFDALVTRIEKMKSRLKTFSN